MDPALRDLLRVHPEPAVYMDDAAVHGALTADPPGYLAHLETGLAAIAAGEWGLELPPKQVFADPGRETDFRVMPCVVRRPGGVCKTVKLVGTNTAGERVPDQLTVGRAFALDAAENFVSAIFAGCLLSSARTGACAAVALGLLAPGSRQVLVRGCGRVGYYAALYAGHRLRPGRLLLEDRHPGRAARAAAVLAGQLPGVRCEAVPGPVPCDALVLATDSTRPLLTAGDGLPATVVSLGADTRWQHEVDASLAGHYRVYADTADGLATGDLGAWREAGLIGPADVTGLLDLVRTGAPDAGPALFVSTGSALLDNLTIDYLLGRGVGEPGYQASITSS